MKHNALWRNREVVLSFKTIGHLDESVSRIHSNHILVVATPGGRRWLNCAFHSTKSSENQPCTSTKLDQVMGANLGARRSGGEVWVATSVAK